MKDERLLTRSHAARRIGVSEGTIRRLALNGVLPTALVTASGERLYRAEDVEAVAAARRDAEGARRP